jgi:hypothetical protein
MTQASRHETDIPVLPDRLGSVEMNHVLWVGVMIGTLIGYMSIVPLVFGCIFGYFMSQKQWVVLDEWLERGSEMTVYGCKWVQPWIEQGKILWTNGWKNKKNM